VAGRRGARPDEGGPSEAADQAPLLARRGPVEEPKALEAGVLRGKRAGRVRRCAGRVARQATAVLLRSHATRIARQTHRGGTPPAPLVGVNGEPAVCAAGGAPGTTRQALRSHKRSAAPDALSRRPSCHFARARRTQSDAAVWWRCNAAARAAQPRRGTPAKRESVSKGGRPERRAHLRSHAHARAGGARPARGAQRRAARRLCCATRRRRSLHRSCNELLRLGGRRSRIGRRSRLSGRAPHRAERLHAASAAPSGARL
jgi:hypothetical protein